jgi:glycosyltransferase involved in cell wall biosynthesis
VIAGASVAVVVPARDEADRIGAVLETMPGWVDRLIVVDDGSRDGTAAVARGARCPAPVELVVHASSLGVGAAVGAGYRQALAAGVDVVAVMAGDGQMDPADLEPLVEPVASGRADYVKGNRLRHPEWRRMPPARLVGTAALGWLTAIAIGRRIGDSQCGYTAASRRALARLDLGRLWPRYGYPNDLLAELTRSGARIAEIPVRPVYRGEPSGLRPWHVGAILYVIGRAAWRRVWS